MRQLLYTKQYVAKAYVQILKYDCSHEPYTSPHIKLHNTPGTRWDMDSW